MNSSLQYTPADPLSPVALRREFSREAVPGVPALDPLSPAALQAAFSAPHLGDSVRASRPPLKRRARRLGQGFMGSTAEKLEVLS
jgi:hypothetical protein